MPKDEGRATTARQRKKIAAEVSAEMQGAYLVACEAQQEFWRSLNRLEALTGIDTIDAEEDLATAFSDVAYLMEMYRCR